MTQKLAKSRAHQTQAPQAVDYALAAGSAGMLAAMMVALFRGQAEWPLLPWPMWVHIATLAIALAITPVMLTRARGDRLHRVLGYIWLASMVLTALVSFLIPRLGTVSPIWILSVLTLFISFKILQTARAHQWAKHRFHVRGIVIGGLLIAGFLTFQFGRIFDRWFSGLTG